MPTAAATLPLLLLEAPEVLTALAVAAAGVAGGTAGPRDGSADLAPGAEPTAAACWCDVFCFTFLAAAASLSSLVAGLLFRFFKAPLLAADELELRRVEESKRGL